jgi:hypothetical protein
MKEWLSDPNLDEVTAENMRRGRIAKRVPES